MCPADGVPTVRADIFRRSDQDPAIGKVFSGRYRIDTLLGEGGMGRVYVATQLSMGRQVALKTLHPEMVKDRRSVRRFYQEAQSASTLSSQHVVRIYDFGVDEATAAPFIAMELLRGSTLSHTVERLGRVPVRRALEIALQVAKALMEAEVAGIVHRDLKPDNIFLVDTVDDEILVKVMDFGIAKMLKGDSDSAQGLTQTGATLGTPTYMSPEQAMGTSVDVRSDLYSLGCVLHEMMLGAPPFHSDEQLTLLMKHFSEPPPPLPVRVGDYEIPEALRNLHLRLLAKQPSLRPPSARATVDALAGLLRGSAVDLTAAPGTARSLADDIETADTGVMPALDATGPMASLRPPSRVSHVALSLATVRQALANDSLPSGRAIRSSHPPSGDVLPVAATGAEPAAAGQQQPPSAPVRRPWFTAVAVAGVAAIALSVWLSLRGADEPVVTPPPVSTLPALSVGGPTRKQAKEPATDPPPRVVNAASTAATAAAAEPAPAPEPISETRPVPETQPAPATALATIEPPGAVEPAGAPAPIETEILVTGLPSATLFRDGKPLGKTPFPVRVALGGEPIPVELRAPGREPAFVRLTDRDAPGVKVTLRPSRPRQPPAIPKTPDPIAGPTIAPPEKPAHSVVVPW